VKVAFYTYPEWAFGSIHEALCREFYKHGVLAHIIDWNRQYSDRDIESFSNLYDVFVTVPGSAVTLLKQKFKVPDNKIVAIAHGNFDVEYGLQEGQCFDSFKGYAVVGNSVREFSKAMGIDKDPRVLYNGVHFDMFYRKAPTEISVLGYGGTLSYQSFNKSTEIKRGHLAVTVAERTGLKFMPVESRHFLTMPAYYESVSCVLLTSCEESFGLPMVEAAASGRLPIGTNVGVLKEYPDLGLVMPVESDMFVDEASRAILDRLKHPEVYRRECLKSQEFVRCNFDWSVVGSHWVEAICG
jgi:glycosyltransferase involved in cell wall biosynthesis